MELERRVCIAWRGERVYPEFASEGRSYNERRAGKIPATYSAVLRSLCATGIARRCENWL